VKEERENREKNNPKSTKSGRGKDYDPGTREAGNGGEKCKTHQRGIEKPARSRKIRGKRPASGGSEEKIHQFDRAQ